MDRGIQQQPGSYYRQYDQGKTNVTEQGYRKQNQRGNTTVTETYDEKITTTNFGQQGISQAEYNSMKRQQQMSRGQGTGTAYRTSGQQLGQGRGTTTQTTTVTTTTQNVAPQGS